MNIEKLGCLYNIFLLLVLLVGAAIIANGFGLDLDLATIIQTLPF